MTTFWNSPGSMVSVRTGIPLFSEVSDPAASSVSAAHAGPGTIPNATARAKRRAMKQCVREEPDVNMLSPFVLPAIHYRWRSLWHRGRIDCRNARCKGLLHNVQHRRLPLYCLSGQFVRDYKRYLPYACHVWLLSRAGRVAYNSPTCHSEPKAKSLREAFISVRRFAGILRIRSE